MSEQKPDCFRFQDHYGSNSMNTTREEFLAYISDGGPQTAIEKYNQAKYQLSGDQKSPDLVPVMECAEQRIDAIMEIYPDIEDMSNRHYQGLMDSLPPHLRNLYL